MISRRYLPSMPSLLALEAVDRLGSASAAAAELNLTQGAISRQLQVLEGQLGLSLIIRDKQRLRLTPAAQDYCREIRRALQALSQASLTLRANPNGGTLNLAILPAFGMHWLAPRLARFAAQHPRSPSTCPPACNPSTSPPAILTPPSIMAGQDWPGVAYLPLMDEELLAVAAPGLLKTPIASANDILSYPLLQLESRTGDWGRWLAHHDLPGQRPPAMLFDQFATMTQGAIHGLGIALLPLFLIARELAENRLTAGFRSRHPVAWQLLSGLAERRRPARAPHLVPHMDHRRA